MFSPNYLSAAPAKRINKGQQSLRHQPTFHNGYICLAKQVEEMLEILLWSWGNFLYCLNLVGHLCLKNIL